MGKTKPTTLAGTHATQQPSSMAAPQNTHNVPWRVTSSHGVPQRRMERRDSKGPYPAEQKDSHVVKRRATSIRVGSIRIGVMNAKSKGTTKDSARSSSRSAGENVNVLLEREPGQPWGFHVKGWVLPAKGHLLNRTAAISDCIITYIEPDSAAERAGLRVGDRIAEANSHKLLERLDVVLGQPKYQALASLRLKLHREDPPLTITHNL